MSQTPQNRVRSDPKPEKNDQHEEKKCKNRSRTSQDRKKGAQERKMCQHKANKAQNPPCFWTALASPKHVQTVCPSKQKMQWDLTRLALQAARRTWRVQRLQNRSQNPKKSMLEKASFLASIFQGFGHRFERFFGRFFRPQMHEKCQDVFFVQHQQNTAWAH